MLGEEGSKDRPAGGTKRAYLRSVSWSDRSPTKPNPNPKPQSNSKARSFLPPLSITRRPVEEWPRAGSDDLGVWPNPQTPRGSIQPLESPSSEQPVREFQFKRDKLAFFDKECSRIADHIYLGSDAVAKNRDILRRNGITHVLNCVGFVCPEYFKNDLVYKTLWLQDSPSEDITSILYDVFDYFEDVREQGGRVFVHCCQGVSRSTSLVIAYLMWREGQSFEDAFQFVKAARGVTNPNMGFACQLLQCQKRVHAVPASPNSVLRIYRMAPHSSYDPLHLVPKMLNHPTAQRFDSRGAFIVHVPSAIYVWIGKKCNQVMSYSAREAANQVIRYERAQGPIMSIQEGDEPLEFWDALARGQLLADGSSKKEVQDEVSYSENDKVTTTMHIGAGEMKVDEYDLDFELFHKALAGGVVPPFSVSTTESETRLPARENGWCRLRRKFANGGMKEFFASSKLKSATSSISDGSNMIIDTCKESEDAVSLTDFSLLSSPPGSPDSFDCFPSGIPDRIRDKEVECSVPHSGHLFPPTPSRGSPHSFSCSRGSSPHLGSKSPTLSPSTSDYSSSFTFSPSSCNWSDFSYLSSRQPSPSGLEATDPLYGRYASLADNSYSPCEETPPSPLKSFSGDHKFRAESACLPCKGIYPSIAERRGSNPPPRLLPSSDKPSLVPKNLVRSWSFSLPDLEPHVMKDMDDNQFDYEGNREELMLDVDIISVGNDSHSEVENEKEYGNVHLPSISMINEVAEVTTPVLYDWPSLSKVEMHSSHTLDSRSVYILLTTDVSLGTNEHRILYVWLGCEALNQKGQRPLISDNGSCKDDHLQLETFNRNIINQMGLPANASVKIVREGEEPEQFLKHLNCFSFQKGN
ncbi:protein-tyrosine-phosphatase MKP1-like [Pistacia vera]|uniref:protein-tyrosine-phosphatase MKP1-like n=1 Tax=Pistacia vera TaxID=55513 RepID=UPI001262AFD4|nr:protein-tyrosine-phosphatase MKP1-like [Pistacia vera]